MRISKSYISPNKLLSSCGQENEINSKAYHESGTFVLGHMLKVKSPQANIIHQRWHRGYHINYLCQKHLFLFFHFLNGESNRKTKK